MSDVFLMGRFCAKMPFLPTYFVCNYLKSLQVSSLLFIIDCIEREWSIEEGRLTRQSVQLLVVIDTLSFIHKAKALNKQFLSINYKLFNMRFSHLYIWWFVWWFWYICIVSWRWREKNNADRSRPTIPVLHHHTITTTIWHLKRYSF